MSIWITEVEHCEHCGATRCAECGDFTCVGFHTECRQSC